MIEKTATDLKLSKFLTRILTKNPQDINIDLNRGGWACVKQLIQKANLKIELDFNDILRIVKKEDVFEISDDFTNIRCIKGHSMEVDLNFREIEPPDFLYYTYKGSDIDYTIGDIENSDKEIELFSDIKSAIKMGETLGNIIILKIDSKEMHRKGYDFYISKTGRYLVEYIPCNYINI